MLIPDFATLQPARLALGLRRRLIERGALLFENSHVRDLRSHPSAQRERHRGDRRDGRRAGARPRGGARRGAGGAGRSRQLRSRLTVTSSHIVLTEPVPDVLEELGWTGGECITDGRTLIHYFRTTRDGRIAFGWGGGRLAYGGRTGGRVEVDAEVAAEVRGHLERMFPALAGRRVTHAWGGPIDVSPSHIPQIGTPARRPRPLRVRLHRQRRGALPPGRAHAGVARPGSARRAHAPCDRRIGAPAPGCRPSRIAWLGGSVVRSALIRREHAEERGEQADPLTRAICAAPRAFGMHLAR